MKNIASIGERICVPAAVQGKIWGTVVARYGRWVLVQTDARYRTAVFVDGRGRVMQ